MHLLLEKGWNAESWNEFQNKCWNKEMRKAEINFNVVFVIVVLVVISIFSIASSSSNLSF